MNVDTALEFFKKVGEKEKELSRIISEKERVEIMMQLTKEGKVDSIVSTNRTPDQIAKDCAHQGNKVLQIKSKEEDKELEN